MKASDRTRDNHGRFVSTPDTNLTKEERRIYVSLWHQQNRERMLVKMRERAARLRAITPKKVRAPGKGKDPIKRKEALRRYYEKNALRIVARAKAFRKSHPETARIYLANKRAHTKNAVPAWANQFFIKEIYSLANLRTKITGIKWEVDHIIPLQSKVVCGLHVENNLQVIPRVHNLAKGNKLDWQSGQMWFNP